MQASPLPTDEEMAAIVAAYRVLQPRVAAAPAERPASSPAWRFSGRWWRRPVAARRDRPWS
jgi:hypothetical protein